MSQKPCQWQCNHLNRFGYSFVTTKENERMDYMFFLQTFLLHQTFESFIDLSGFLVEHCWLIIFDRKISRTTSIHGKFSESNRTERRVIGLLPTIWCRILSGKCTIIKQNGHITYA